MASTSKVHLPYAERIKYHSNPSAIKLLEIMERKKTNLCVSVDVITAEEILTVVRRVGASCCMVKVSAVMSERSGEKMVDGKTKRGSS